MVDERDDAIVGRQQTFLTTLYMTVVLRQDYPSFLKVRLEQTSAIHDEPNPCADVAIWAEVSRKSRVSAACATSATVRSAAADEERGKGALVGSSLGDCNRCRHCNLLEPHSARLPHRTSRMEGVAPVCLCLIGRLRVGLRGPRQPRKRSLTRFGALPEAPFGNTVSNPWRVERSTRQPASSSPARAQVCLPEPNLCCLGQACPLLNASPLSRSPCVATETCS